MPQPFLAWPSWPTQCTWSFPVHIPILRSWPYAVRPTHPFHSRSRKFASSTQQPAPTTQNCQYFSTSDEFLQFCPQSQRYHLQWTRFCFQCQWPDQQVFLWRVSVFRSKICGIRFRIACHLTPCFWFGLGSWEARFLASWSCSVCSKVQLTRPCSRKGLTSLAGFCPLLWPIPRHSFPLTWHSC